MALPQQKLTPEQECIMTLAAIIGAIHYESDDPVSKQFVTMMISQAAKEYQETSKDPLAVAIFNPPAMTAKFREAMVLMREGLKEIKNKPEQVLRATKFPVSKNGHTKK